MTHLRMEDVCRMTHRKEQELGTKALDKARLFSEILQPSPREQREWPKDRKHRCHPLRQQVAIGHKITTQGHLAASRTFHSAITPIPSHK